jgi:hypothetical protein
VQYRLWHPYARYVDRRGESVSKRAAILELSATRENTLGFDRFSGKLIVVDALMDGYLCDSVLYFARRWKDKPLLDEIGKGQNAKEALHKPKSNYTGNSMERYYIDFDSEHQPPSVKSNELETEKYPTTQHNRNERPKKDPSVQKIQCLLLLEGGYTNMLSAYYCLILKKHEPLFPESHPDYYQHIGLGAFNTRHVCVSSEKNCTGQHEGYSGCMGITQKVQIM